MVRRRTPKAHCEVLHSGLVLNSFLTSNKCGREAIQVFRRIIPMVLVFVVLVSGNGFAETDQEAFEKTVREEMATRNDVDMLLRSVIELERLTNAGSDKDTSMPYRTMSLIISDMRNDEMSAIREKLGQVALIYSIGVSDAELTRVWRQEQRLDRERIQEDATRRMLEYTPLENPWPDWNNGFQQIPFGDFSWIHAQTRQAELRFQQRTRDAERRVEERKAAQQAFFVSWSPTNTDTYRQYNEWNREIERKMQELQVRIAAWEQRWRQYERASGRF